MIFWIGFICAIILIAMFVSLSNKFTLFLVKLRIYFLKDEIKNNRKFLKKNLDSLKKFIKEVEKVEVK